jgi:hypothetical protein
MPGVRVVREKQGFSGVKLGERRHRHRRFSIMSDFLSFRPGRGSDAPLLSRIAQAAKASWGYSAETLRRWLPELTISAAFVETHATLVWKSALDVVPSSCRRSGENRVFSVQCSRFLDEET